MARPTKKQKQQIAQVLGRAYETILVRTHWTKDAFARAGRKKVTAFDPTANRFCIAGAILRADREINQDQSLAKQAITIIEQEIALNAEKASIADFNDAKETSHEDVLLMMKKAYHRALEEVPGKK